MFRTIETQGGVSCTLAWPEGALKAEQAFVWYSFSLGFAIPVAAISVFYFLVVVRLGKVGAVQQTKGKVFILTIIYHNNSITMIYFTIASFLVALINPLKITLKTQSNGPLYSNMVIGTLAVDGWAVV